MENDEHDRTISLNALIPFCKLAAALDNEIVSQIQEKYSNTIMEESKFAMICTNQITHIHNHG